MPADKRTTRRSALSYPLRVAHHSTAPSTSTHRDNRGREWVLDVEWLISDGRAEPISVKVSQVREPGEAPGTISASQLRALPLGSWIAEARANEAGKWRAAFAQSAESGEPSGIDAVHTASLWGPHRGRSSTRAELERVAAAYMDAVNGPGGVTRAVADACGVSESTAGKRIMAARRAGLIPEVKR